MSTITPEIFRSWQPCAEGYRRFLELLPDGGTLEEIIRSYVLDGQLDWGYWVLNQVQDNPSFREEILETITPGIFIV